MWNRQIKEKPQVEQAFSAPESPQKLHRRDGLHEGTGYFGASGTKVAGTFVHKEKGGCCARPFWDSLGFLEDFFGSQGPRCDLPVIAARSPLFNFRNRRRRVPEMESSGASDSQEFLPWISVHFRRPRKPRLQSSRGFLDSKDGRYP